METTKISYEYQVKGEKDKLTKVEKELDKIKTERAKWETKAQAVEAELNVRFFSIRIYLQLLIVSIHFRSPRNRLKRQNKL